MKNIQFIFIAICGLGFFGCSPSGGEYTGTEYMPDMGHSVAYEANYYDYYRYNRWGTEDDYHKMAQPRLPVQGTIPRGYAGVGSSPSKYAMLRGKNAFNAIATTPNGSVPYYYKDTEAERTRAMNNIIENPFPITSGGLAEGKNLYDIFCGICHGKKGDGNGYLVADENTAQAYPAQPANLISEEFISATNGRYYHAIMHGKNVMGGYADKLSYEERWQVIHYIRSLQAKSTGGSYAAPTNVAPGGGSRSNSGNGGAQLGMSSSSRANGGNGGAHLGIGGHTSQGAMQSGNMKSTTTQSGVQLQSSTQSNGGGGEVTGAAAGIKEKKGLKKFLKKTGDKIKKGGSKVKKGTKKAGSKIKDAIKGGNEE